MHIQRRSPFLAVLFCAPALGGCARVGSAAPAVTVRADAGLLARIDRSLARAASFLVSRQGADGRWTSRRYGSFRDDLALTPHVLSALAFMPQGGEAARGAVAKGLRVLHEHVTDSGQIDNQRSIMAFPVYTAAEVSWLFTLDDDSKCARKTQRAWLNYLRELQLNEQNGWQPSDLEYGGWGYEIGIPRKPPPGVPRGALVESNLSATIFALGAFVSAEVPRDDPAFRQARVFVERCQNFSEDPARSDPQFDDGGFFFIPGDAAKNKAGIAGEDRFGRVRFHSYGSMTADGVRALLQSGLPSTHPRVVAARNWLVRNFAVEHNAGRWADDRDGIRDATYYYYCWSIAHALVRLDVRQVESVEGTVDWTVAFAKELIHRQSADGSWTNRFTDSKEDDPLVSTPFAAAALAICRKSQVDPAKSIGHAGAARSIHGGKSSPR